MKLFSRVSPKGKSQNMIEVRNLRKSYKTGDFVQKALDDVSIAFRDNEFAAILGTSGSGKTTLLNIIGGLDHADSGDILITTSSPIRQSSRTSSLP